MSRIPPADLPADLPIHNNLVRTAYNNPELFRGFASLSGRVHSASHLSDRTRELVVLAVVGRLGAAYEQQQHEPGARRVGVTEAEIVALRAGDVSAFAGAERAAVRYALAVETRTVDDALWGEVHHDLTDVELLDITMLAGFYGLASRLVLALDVDLEPPAS
jgi:4-carboxymuconolactone decarboxylase